MGTSGVGRGGEGGHEVRPYGSASNSGRATQLEGHPSATNEALSEDSFIRESERYRRSLFFHPDELVPVDDSGEAL